MHDKNEPAHTVLLAAARNTPVASRMANRFAKAGCRVAAVYPSKAHLLAGTRSVSSHHHLGAVDPVGTLLTAMSESGAELVAPCDGLAVRHLHSMYASLPATAEGSAFANLIQASLGDPSAYLVVDSRHEIQMAARAEGLDAAESFALGKATDPEKIAQSLPFPWIVKSDYSWGNAEQKLVRSLAEAKQVIRTVGAPPSLLTVAGQLVANGDRSALEGWLHGKRPALSAQRPLNGAWAATAASCWKGSLLASISVVADSPSECGPPAIVRIVESKDMERTVRRMADRLELTGFHSFRFVVDAETGKPWLTGIDSHCSRTSHLNAGPGRDPFGAFCQRWLGVPSIEQLHAEQTLAYFPEAWIEDPSDSMLDTQAFDLPSDDPDLVKRVKQMAVRRRKFARFFGESCS